MPAFAPNTLALPPSRRRRVLKQSMSRRHASRCAFDASLQRCPVHIRTARSSAGSIPRPQAIRPASLQRRSHHRSPSRTKDRYPQFLATTSSRRRTQRTLDPGRTLYFTCRRRYNAERRAIAQRWPMPATIPEALISMEGILTFDVCSNSFVRRDAQQQRRLLAHPLHRPKTGLRNLEPAVFRRLSLLHVSAGFQNAPAFLRPPFEQFICSGGRQLGG